MVGRGENVNFRCTFDGDGHTLTVNYVDNNNENACAPFRFIRNATIRNLHVAGKITKSQKLFAGGLVGMAYGNCHISNCHSSVRIVCHDGDCSSGGFIGELGTSNDPDDTYIDNCFFDGRLEGTNSNHWGGFIGWVEDQPDAYITNCLFSPAYVDVNDEGNKTFARGDDIHLTNCYYKHLLTDAQGSTKARDMDNETLCMKLGVAWEVFAGQELPIMTPRPLTNGEGTKQSPYLIASISDWHRLATNVYLGESYYEKQGREATPTGTPSTADTSTPSPTPPASTSTAAARSSSAEPAAIPPAPVLPFIHISGKVAPKGRRKTMVSTNRPMVSTNRPMVSTNRPMVLTIVFCRPFGSFAAPTMMRRVFAAPSALVKGLMGGGSGNLKMIHALPTERAEVPKKTYSHEH